MAASVKDAVGARWQADTFGSAPPDSGRDFAPAKERDFRSAPTARAPVALRRCSGSSTLRQDRRDDNGGEKKREGARPSPT